MLGRTENYILQGVKTCNTGCVFKHPFDKNKRTACKDNCTIKFADEIAILPGGNESAVAADDNGGNQKMMLYGLLAVGGFMLLSKKKKKKR